VGGLYREPRENLQALLFVMEIKNPWHGEYTKDHINGSVDARNRFDKNR
jgi:hypothetical protein